MTLFQLHILCLSSLNDISPRLYPVPVSNVPVNSAPPVRPVVASSPQAVTSMMSATMMMIRCRIVPPRAVRRPSGRVSECAGDVPLAGRLEGEHHDRSPVRADGLSRGFDTNA